MTKTGQCTCTHTYQDKTYGNGNRVFNHAPSKGAKSKRYRCTVCKKEQDL